MSPRLLSCVGLLCAIAVSVGLWFAVPQVTHQPHGIFLPAQNFKAYKGPPSSTVFLIDRYPLVFTKLGIIRVEQHFAGNNAPAIQQQAISYARHLAAIRGATAIVVSQAFFDQPTGAEAGMGNFTLIGTAIKVPQADF